MHAGKGFQTPFALEHKDAMQREVSKRDFVEYAC